MNSLVGSSFVHEELLADDVSMDNSTLFDTLQADDLVGQSAKIVREYLTQAIPIRRQLITKLIEEKNSSELTNFLLKGQKIRGTQPITNRKSFVNQENSYLPRSKTISTKSVKTSFRKIKKMVLVTSCITK